MYGSSADSPVVRVFSIRNSAMIPVIPKCDDERRAGYHPWIVRLCPEGPADRDSMLGTEIVTQHAHAAEMAFFGINAIAFYPDKNTHGAQINTFMMGMTMARFFAEIGIDIDLKSYRSRWSDFQGDHRFFGSRIHSYTSAGGPVSGFPPLIIYLHRFDSRNPVPPAGAKH